MNRPNRPPQRFGNYDPEELRVYLKELEVGFSRDGFPAEAAGVRVVLGDLFPDRYDSEWPAYGHRAADTRT